MNLEGKWDYLGKEWKTILFNNPVVIAIDSFLTKINVVFLVVFGINYSFSIQFLFTIILWLFFISWINNVFKIVSIFSEKICLLISIALIIGGAQIGMLEWPVNTLIWVLFGQKELWMKLIIGLVTIIALFLIGMFLKKFAKQAKKNREELRIEKDKMELHQGAKVAEAISEATIK